jgi:hypothetical protein
MATGTGDWDRRRRRDTGNLHHTGSVNRISMIARRKFAIRASIIVAVAAGVAAIVIGIHRRQRIVLQGAVTTQDADPKKQQPIANVQITATTGFSVTTASTDAAGFFRIALPKGFRRRQSVKFNFTRPGYQPVELNEFVGDKLYIARMLPIVHEAPSESDHQSDHHEIVVSNVRVRYSVKTTTEADVGSAVRTFQIVSAGNLPCNGRKPCSPDGKWKAAPGAASVDAGIGNEFRNARVSCIAGPCPFTKIEFEDLSQDGRILNVKAIDWSDTTTFLVEAEVVHPMVSDIVRESYPVIFGQALSFSLPASAEGPSIEAEINADSIVFPLGPSLFLSWAQCTLETSKDQTRVYRCELKPGYRFQ